MESRKIHTKSGMDRIVAQEETNFAVKKKNWEWSQTFTVRVGKNKIVLCVCSEGSQHISRKHLCIPYKLPVTAKMQEATLTEPNLGNPWNFQGQKHNNNKNPNKQTQKKAQNKTNKKGEDIISSTVCLYHPIRLVAVRQLPFIENDLIVALTLAIPSSPNASLSSSAPPAKATGKLVFLGIQGFPFRARSQ